MDYRIVTVSVPRKLCQKMVEGIGTQTEAWDAYDILKLQIRKDEASVALARPFHMELERPSLDQSMVDADVHDSRPYDGCMGVFEDFGEYAEDMIDPDHRSPGC